MDSAADLLPLLVFSFKNTFLADHQINPPSSTRRVPGPLADDMSMPTERPPPWPSRRVRKPRRPSRTSTCCWAATTAVVLAALMVGTATRAAAALLLPATFSTSHGNTVSPWEVAEAAAQAALPTAQALAGVVGFQPPPLQLLLARTPPWAESCSRRPPLSPPPLLEDGVGAAARPSSAAAATLQHPPPPSQRSRPPDEGLHTAAATPSAASASAGPQQTDVAPHSGSAPLQSPTPTTLASRLASPSLIWVPASSKIVDRSDDPDEDPDLLLLHRNSWMRTAAHGAELGGVTGKTMDDLDDEMYGNQYVNVGPYDK